MNLKPLLAVTRKELTDSSRDRRAIYVLLFSALFGPILIAFMLNQIAGQEKAAQEIRVPVVGGQFGPILVSWLGQQTGVEIVPGPADAEKAVRDRSAEFVLVIEKDFAEKFRDSRPAPVKIFSDSTRESTRSKVKRLRTLLERFSAITGSMRLIARGVNPSIVSSLKLSDVEVSNGQQRAARVFNILPMFLILAAFTTSMQIATDSTAGERERGSLEPLLLNPVPRWQLMTGKWLAAAAVSLTGMIATLLITSAMLSRLPLEDLGVRYHLGKPEMLMLLSAVAPIALIAPAMQMYLACFAKSFKEAQSYMGFLVFAVTIPGIASSFYPMTNQPWLHPIPIVGQYAMALDTLGGKVPSVLSLVASDVAALAMAGLLLALATRLLSDEKIIFGR